MPVSIALRLAALWGLLAPIGLASAQDATPMAGAEVAFVAALPAEILPCEAGPVYVERATYEPGASEELVPDNGLTVVVVETGALAFVGTGVARLLDADGTVEETLTEGEADLVPGSGAVLPAGAGATLTNQGTTAATALMIGVYPAAGFEPVEPSGADAPGGTQNWALLGKGSPQEPPVASTLSVERATLAPGAELAMDEAGVAVAYLETGAIMATVEKGLAEASSGAFLRTGGVGPGAAFVAAGDDRRVRAEGSLFVQPGTSLTLGNDGDEPAQVLVVRLAPLGLDLGTPVAP